MNHSFPLWLFSLFSAIAVPCRAGGLEALLDRSEITIDMDHSTALYVSLQNRGSSSIYLTGVQVLLSDGASGDVYNPALLQERLRKLDPGQNWDGPLIVVTPKHRGPLLVKGTMVLKGGASPQSGDALISVPLLVTINDPRRNVDGSYDLGAKPVCDRPVERCCDLSESRCFQVANHCIYVAEGYDSQEVCVDQSASSVYEHISDLRVSSDGSHVAFIASTNCAFGANEEHCKRTGIVDHGEIQGPGVPSRLCLSPDGRHYAYLARSSCITRFGVVVCSGTAHKIVDGKGADIFPAWCSGS